MISVWMDTNEKGSDRAKAMETTVAGDDRFSWQGFADLPVDLTFEGLVPARDGDGQAHRLVYTELKEPQDYLQSVLSGHLYSQILTLQELGLPAFVAVLGGVDDINKAVTESALKRRTAGSKQETVASTIGRLRDFRANAYALGVPVLYDMTPGDILSHATKILEGGDLMAHRPRPANGERQVAALCMLVPGVGPKKARALLDHFGSLRGIYERVSSAEIIDSVSCLQEVDGIGKVRAKSIVEALR